MKNSYLLVVPIFAAPLQASIVIDNFNTGGFTFSQLGAGSTTETQTGLSTSDTIGGVREISAVNISGTGNNSVNNEAISGLFTWSQDSDTNGSFVLSYGSYLSSPNTADLNADFTVDNIDTIAFTLQQTDLGGTLTVTFSMNGGASVWATDITIPLAVGLGGEAAGHVVQAEFSSFAQVSGGAFDASDVDGIRIESHDHQSRDWQFDMLTAAPIPEPSTTALLGLAGITLILRRRHT